MLGFGMALRGEPRNRPGPGTGQRPSILAAKWSCLAGGLDLIQIPQAMIRLRGTAPSGRHSESKAELPSGGLSRTSGDGDRIAQNGRLGANGKTIRHYDVIRNGPVVGYGGGDKGNSIFTPFGCT